MPAHSQLLQKYQMHIGGRWVEPASGDYFKSDNPYTGRPWALIPRGNAGDVDLAVQAGYHGIVIEATGGGHVPDTRVPEPARF